jgi:hypothetical protein
MTRPPTRGHREWRWAEGYSSPTTQSPLVVAGPLVTDFVGVGSMHLRSDGVQTERAGDLSRHPH